MSARHKVLTHGQERLFCKVTSVFEETKGVIRICKSKDKKKGGHTTQWPKRKRTNNDLQNTHIKLKI